MSFPRRALLPIAALAALALAGCNPSAGGAHGDAAVNVGPDKSLGKATAPVTVIEYASPTCPGCAAWNADVFPAFKAKYVDSGKVRYVLREAIIHGAADAAVYLIARCSGDDDYFKVVDEAMRTFPDARKAGDARAWMDSLGKTGGLNPEQVEACISDPEKLSELNARFDAQMREHDVQGTPTFVVNGKKVETAGPPTLDQLSAIIDPLLKK